MSKVSLHPICIKNQDENNNILGLDTSELRFGSVQNLYLELETLPLTELFRSHIHVCDICNKDFQFPSQVEKHKSVHDKSKGLVCTWEGCKKVLANKDSLKQYVQCHQDLKLKCDQCQESRSYPTTISLKQHQQGQHGNSWGMGWVGIR